MRTIKTFPVKELLIPVLAVSLYKCQKSYPLYDAGESGILSIPVSTRMEKDGVPFGSVSGVISQPGEKTAYFIIRSETMRSGWY